MKRLISLAIITLFASRMVLAATAASPGGIAHGFYAGIGGGGTYTNESFSSNLSSSNTASALDNYYAASSRIAPTAQLGYWSPFNKQWLWGAQMAWMYSGYKTPNNNGDHGEYIPNATFSSKNFFGPDGVRNFDSQTKVNNQLTLLLYLGMQISQGYAYLGIGPALFTASNSIYVSSVHTPDGTGNRLVSTSVSSSQNTWGGVIQLGYNYYLDSSWFLNLSYSYLQSATANFNNSNNSEMLNGASSPGPETLYLNRSISWSSQNILLSINKVF